MAGSSWRRRRGVTPALALILLMAPAAVAAGGDDQTDASVPTGGAEPAGLSVDASGNGVYQPNEFVIVAPLWRNTGSTPLTFTGFLTNHTGPAIPIYSIPDSVANYGTIAPGVTGSCSAINNCYSVSNITATRPVVHWDSTALETLSPPVGPPKTWVLHIGNSFTDVPSPLPFFRFIETILHHGVTAGCSTLRYCPAASTSRAQMAVFVLVAKEGRGYTPPTCVAGLERFADVPASSPFCRWAEEVARRGVTTGCGGGNFCPSAGVRREEMAVFLLRTLDPALVPPPCAPPNLYNDVPETSPFCPWIEELTNRGVVAGCNTGNYCPAAPVTREEMSVFLSMTFGLTLYGV